MGKAAAHGWCSWGPKSPCGCSRTGNGPRPSVHRCLGAGRGSSSRGSLWVTNGHCGVGVPLSCFRVTPGFPRPVLRCLQGLGDLQPQSHAAPEGKSPPPPSPSKGARERASSAVTSRQARLIRCCSHGQQPMDSPPSTGFGDQKRGQD